MKIATVFSGRADYAPLSPVIAELEKRAVTVLKYDLTPQLMDDSPRSITHALTHGMDNLAEWLSSDRPDYMLLLGDRYETLGAAHVATLFRIPIAHIHGGEKTEGSFDDGFRHAITQLADIHFVSAGEHRDRVHGMGTRPEAVHLVGAPGLDNIVDLPEREFDGPYFLVTYHPETRGRDGGAEAILEALRAFPEYGAIWTGVNNDPGASFIYNRFSEPGLFIQRGDMGPKRYLSAMKYAACCIGNSSSFLIEAPALGVPTVNVGDRQKGRLHGPSVFNVGSLSVEVVNGITSALMSNKFDNPYGQPGASKRIADILAQQSADTSASQRKKVA